MGNSPSHPIPAHPLVTGGFEEAAVFGQGGIPVGRELSGQFDLQGCPLLGGRPGMGLTVTCPVSQRCLR